MSRKNEQGAGAVLLSEDLTLVVIAPGIVVDVLVEYLGSVVPELRTVERSNVGEGLVSAVLVLSRVPRLRLAQASVAARNLLRSVAGVEPEQVTLPLD